MTFKRPPCPPLQYELSPCQRCGAKDIEDAENKCRPVEAQTGERECAGMFNDNGDSVRATTASIKAVDDWCEMSVWD